MHEAAYRGHHDVASLLLASGADLVAIDAVSMWMEVYRHFIAI